jgi:hypothetical protein
MGLLIWLGAFFQAKIFGHTSRSLVYLFGSIWGFPKAPKQDKKRFSGRFALFLLQKWAY